MITDRLDKIESDLGYIKNHISDVDIFLTDDDLDALEQADKDFGEGKIKRL